VAIKFLINPIAGGQRGRRYWQALHRGCQRLGYAEGRDFSLEWTHTEHLAEQARRAAAYWNRVVAVGGDGTVRAVAEGLFQAGTDAALGVIPLGTGNDFSRAVGFDRLWAQRRRFGLAHVIQRLSVGPTAALDVLTLNDWLCFVSYASTGLDAYLSYAYERLRRRPVWQMLLRGRLINECAYGALGLRYHCIRLPPLHLHIRVPSTGWTTLTIPHHTCAVIVSNVTSYAGGSPLTPGSSPRDGCFEVTVVPRLWSFALLIAARGLPFLRRRCRLQTHQANEARLSLPSGYAVQVDGEDHTAHLAGATALSIRVAGQIRVVCP